jgi:deazaflavin-dependent oxidoreductase (nitroreductase family)
MARKTKELTPPKGCSRAFFRFPIWLYRANLGWLLGGRFLLLNHVGRKTGLPRQAVLEVVQHDQETDTYVVAVGFGKKSAWYRNLLAQPEVSIQVGRRKLDVTAGQLPPEEAGEVFLDFTRRYPGEAKFAGMLGYEVDGSEEDYRKMGEMMTLIALRPR